MSRISTHQLLISFAVAVAGRSTCGRLEVGAVLKTTDGRLSYGYNGRAHDEEHCNTEPMLQEPGQCGCVHAELNALLKGGDTHGSTLYISHSPCMMCARAIVNARVAEVFYVEEYRSLEALILLERAGIRTYHWGHTSPETT